MQHRVRSTLTVVVLVLAACLAVVAQPQPGISVRGRVVSAETGAPLARTHIALVDLSTLPDGIHALTNVAGEYELRGVPPGSYTVRATKNGFVSLASGQRRPGDASRRVIVTSAGSPEAINFALSRGGVIVVHVVDDRGEPIAGVSGQAWQRGFWNGERQLVQAGDLPVSNVTNDLGEVRLTGLVPGAYYVSAGMGFLQTSEAQRRTGRGYRNIYYPGTAESNQAVPVNVGPGQEVMVSIQLRPPEPLYQVTGVVMRTDGKPLQNAQVAIGEKPGDKVSTWTGPGGAFTLPGRYPGEHFIEVGLSNRGDPDSSEVGSVRLSIPGDDSSNVTIITRPAARIQGRVVFEGDTPPSRPDGFDFTAPRYPGDLFLPRFTIRDDWTFEGAGFNGSRTIRLRSAPGGWMLKSVTLNGQDVTDTPVDFETLTRVSDVEITVTQIQSTVIGRAVDARNTSIADFVAIVFARDPQEWTSSSRFFGSAVADAQGQFTVSKLPPGRYLVAAVDGLQSGQERDPELLERISRNAVSITLREGETRTVDLRVNVN